MPPIGTVRRISLLPAKERTSLLLQLFSCGAAPVYAENVTHNPNHYEQDLRNEMCVDQDFTGNGVLESLYLARYVMLAEGAKREHGFCDAVVPNKCKVSFAAFSHLVRFVISTTSLIYGGKWNC